MNKRKRIPNTTETAILTKSARRCAICFGLQSDLATKKGQIAHLDRDRTNNAEDNLAFLCLDHHDEYDSKTSQSKGLTAQEVKMYREQLYQRVSSGRLDQPQIEDPTLLDLHSPSLAITLWQYPVPEDENDIRNRLKDWVQRELRSGRTTITFSRADDELHFERNTAKSYVEYIKSVAGEFRYQVDGEPGNQTIRFKSMSRTNV